MVRTWLAAVVAEKKNWGLQHFSYTRDECTLIVNKQIKDEKSDRKQIVLKRDEPSVITEKLDRMGITKHTCEKKEKRGDIRAKFFTHTQINWSKQE